MEFHPDPCIALLVSDQADVIDLFLELMKKRTQAESVCEMKTTGDPKELLFDANDASFLGGMLDFE